MQINNVSTGYSDPAALGKQGETTEAAGTGRTRAGRLRSSASAESSAALADILSRHDVTDITPAQFSEMIRQLHEANAISEDELRQLAAIRHDLDAEDVDPDESIDLIEFYVDKIEKLQRRLDAFDEPFTGRRRLGPLLGRLDWIEKFSLIQAAPDAIGLDALA